MAEGFESRNARNAQCAPNKETTTKIIEEGEKEQRGWNKDEMADMSTHGQNEGYWKILQKKHVPSFQFGSWTYSGNFIDLRINGPEGANISEQGIDIQYYVQNGEWNLLGGEIIIFGNRVIMDLKARKTE